MLLAAPNRVERQITGHGASSSRSGPRAGSRQGWRERGIRGGEGDVEDRAARHPPGLLTASPRSDVLSLVGPSFGPRVHGSWLPGSSESTLPEREDLEPRSDRKEKPMQPSLSRLPLHTVLAAFLANLVLVSIVNRALPSPSWNVVASPNPGAAECDLRAVAGVSANDAWAVGSYENTSF